MFDRALRGYIDPVLKKTTGLLIKQSIKPNHLTITGGIFAILCFIALSFQFYMTALFFLTLNRFFDGLDGVLARSIDEQGGKGSSDFGGYLDIVADFIFYSGFVFFFVVGNMQYLFPALFLLFSFFATGTSFLAYAIFEAKHRNELIQRQATNKLQKSFYYIGGLAEGTETIICFVLMCLFPENFFYFVIVFGTMCWLTTFTRGFQAFQTLR